MTMLQLAQKMVVAATGSPPEHMLLRPQNMPFNSHGSKSDPVCRPHLAMMQVLPKMHMELALVGRAT